MSKMDPEEVGLDKLLSWIDKLSPQELEGLEWTIQKKVWGRRIQRLGAIPEHASATLQRFIERVETGNIDEDIRTTVDRTCTFVLEQFMSLSEISNASQGRGGSSWRDILTGFRPDDPTREMEQIYEDLQSNLIQIRQAVAQAIATEKQLEQQLQKNQMQAITWQDRANMATAQGNDDLCAQAMKRKDQYVNAATVLESQLHAHKAVVNTLRERLTDTEVSVQKAYTKKTVLAARYKAAVAANRADELLSTSSHSSAAAVMERMEKAVFEQEAQAIDRILAHDQIMPELDAEHLLRATVKALERCTSVIESMEKKVAACEAQAAANVELREAEKASGDSAAEA
jgi:phage shock protein A